MKSSIIKIALSIVVLLSSLGIQSCKKEAAEITPVNTSIIGKWKAISGTKTIEREFIKGADTNSGTGNFKSTNVDAFGTVTIITAPFTWDINNNTLNISQLADIAFIFQLTDNGNRLILFDNINTNQLSFTFERIN